MTGNGPRAAGVLLAALALSAWGARDAGAREVWSRGETSLDVSGTLRELMVGTQGTSEDDFAALTAANPAQCLLAENFLTCPAFSAVNQTPVVTSLTRLRAEVELKLPHRLSAYLAYDQEVSAGTLDTFEAQLGEAVDTEQWAPLDWTIVDTDSVRWDHLFYRLYLDWDGEHAGVRVGRQRVPWGVGRLWNPIDRFNALPPLAIQADQSTGVDAVNLRWRFSGFTYLQGVYAAAADPDDQSGALRLHGTLWDVDYSIVGGNFEGAWTAGFDLDGNLGQAAARAEVVWSHSNREIRPIGAGAPFELGSYWQAVASIDYLFDLGTGVYALLEHLYNGNALGFGAGTPGNLLPLFAETDTPPPGTPPMVEGPFVTFASNARFGGSRVVTRSHNLTGVELYYDLTPEVRADFLAIYDWEGHSASFFPSLRWNATDWLEITVAGQLFAGPRLSEYGSFEPLGFLIADVFF